jgi:predicted KAP-like P-loop ATPase
MNKLNVLEPNHFNQNDRILNLCVSEKYLNGLTKFIKENILPPFTISIDGDWGTGKTHLMKLIEKNLVEEGFPTIWFNPWEYEKIDSCYIAFLKKLSISFRDNFNISFKDLGIFGLTLAISSIDGVMRLFTNDSINYKNIKEIADDITDAIDNEASKYRDTIQELKNDFKRITDTITSSKKYKEKPLIIFLDDLDRCLPDNALRLLEALKNTLCVKDAMVIFIIGQNINVIKKYLVHEFPSITLDYASNYFKKIFDLSIKIPGFQKEQINSFIDFKLSQLFDKPPKELINKIADLNFEVDNNSLRVIDKVIYNFAFYKSVIDKNELDEDFVLFWLFLKEKWPEDFDALDSDIFKDLNKSFASIQTLPSYENGLTSACIKFLKIRFEKYNEIKFFTLRNNQLI